MTLIKKGDPGVGEVTLDAVDLVLLGWLVVAGYDGATTRELADVVCASHLQNLTLTAARERLAILRRHGYVRLTGRIWRLA